jgi:hypothetical protein
MTNKTINTDLSGLVSVLRENGEIRLTEAASMLELSESETENLAKKLADYGILEMRYSLKGHKTLKKGARIAESKDTPKELHKKHHISAETEKAFNTMRQKIAEKKERGIPKTALTTAEKDKAESDYERQERLREIKEGLISVRENLEKIRSTLESDLKGRQESYKTQTDLN